MQNLHRLLYYLLHLSFCLSSFSALAQGQKHPAEAVMLAVFCRLATNSLFLGTCALGHGASQLESRHHSVLTDGINIPGHEIVSSTQYKILS